MDIRALVTGTATYTDPSAPPLPAVQACVNDVADVLDGVPVLDPQRPEDVLRPLEAMASSRLDVLLFYYAGHGMLGTNDSLCLGLPGSVDHKDQARRTSLPVDAVFEVLDRARAKTVVAVLDCCHAARALQAPRTHRTHVLMATDAITKAMSPVGDRYTAFTAALLELCRDGVPDGPENLSLDLTFRHLDVALRAAGHPAPHQSTVDYSGDVPFAPNPAHGTAHTRDGLLSRARYADRSGRARRHDQAVELFTRIVRDASAAFGPLDGDVSRFRRALAGWVGTAGDPAKAVEILTKLIDGLPPGDENVPAAHTSRDYWLTQSWPT
ncbi:caspase family protein [Actinocrispum sp. NPDC049592]|uniref:caspase, EACC1-associated type n=1 Tax=Actinocrispum sp. NPDC049592 TaxID=3154835 RepID=UPI00343202D6